MPVPTEGHGASDGLH